LFNIRYNVDIMRPEHVIMIDSPSLDNRVDISKWCFDNVGQPFNIIERPEDGVPWGPDYNDGNGKWVAFINNTYVYGQDRPVDTWCFTDSSDAVAFRLKWG
jgi:hypothetical protein